MITTSGLTSTTVKIQPTRSVSTWATCVTRPRNTWKRSNSLQVIWVSMLPKPAKNIRNRASDIASSASETASDLANRADRAVRAAPSRIRSAGGRGGRWVKDNPIPAGLMCVAAGATIASVLAVRNTTDGNETDNQPDHQRTAPERRDENNADTPINTPQPVKSPISATTMPSKTASGSVVENGATSAKDQNAAETGKADSTADALKSPRPKLSTARV